MIMRACMARCGPSANGYYSYNTIRPGAYPNTRMPAHVHYVRDSAGYKDRRFELWMSDDPSYLANPERAQKYPTGNLAICAVTRDERGVWHCAQDIVMERK